MLRIKEDRMTDMDRKLVAAEEQYEVAYFASKHGLTADEARRVLERAGRSREKADELAESGKGR
jgi:hypothetical protein